MHLYGNERNTTPNIDSLAKNSYVFTRAFSQSSHTMPSLYSTFSSTYLSQHGVLPGMKREDVPENMMLAELLAEKGYETFGLTGGGNIRGENGFGAGFDRYEEIADLNQSNNSMEEQQQLSFLEEQIESSEGEFFMFYQSFKPHDPYYAEKYPGYYEPFLPGFRNESKQKMDNFSKKYQGDKFFRKFRDYYFEKAEENETVREYMKAEYDGTIRGTDEFVGEITELLKKKGEYENSIIIINSQHGEQFYQRGLWRHDTSLYNEVIRVPLIIRVPDRKKGETIDQYVENIDIAPTISDMVLSSVPDKAKNQWEGTSLTPILNGEDIPKKFVLSERYNGETAFIDVETGIKYYNKDTGEEFYDIDTDFDEKNPLNQSETAIEVKRRFKQIYANLVKMDFSTDMRPYFG